MHRAVLAVDRHQLGARGLPHLRAPPARRRSATPCWPGPGAGRRASVASVTRRPAKPTTPLTHTSASAPRLARPSSPTRSSHDGSAALSSSRWVPSATATTAGRRRAACAASAATSRPLAPRATIRNRSGSASTTSMVWVPIEPVDPASATVVVNPRTGRARRTPRRRTRTAARRASRRTGRGSRRGPGRVAAMSFTPRSRLSSDSHRSPIGAATAAARPIRNASPNESNGAMPTPPKRMTVTTRAPTIAADQALDGLVRAGLGERTGAGAAADRERPHVVGDGGDHRGQQEADAVGTAQHQRGERAEPADPPDPEQGDAHALEHPGVAVGTDEVPPEGGHDRQRDQERVGVGPLPVHGERRQQDGDVAEQGGRLEPGAADRVEELEGADREDGDDQGHRDRRAEHERGHAEDGEAHAPDDRRSGGRGPRPMRAGRSRRRRWRTRPPGCGGAPGGGGGRRRRAPRPRPPRTTRARTRCSGRGRSR